MSQDQIDEVLKLQLAVKKAEAECAVAEAVCALEIYNFYKCLTTKLNKKEEKAHESREN